MFIFPEVWELEWSHAVKMTFKITDGHCRWCHSVGHNDFMLVFHCNSVSVMYGSRDISYFPKIRGNVTLSTPPLGSSLSCMCLYSSLVTPF